MTLIRSAAALVALCIAAPSIAGDCEPGLAIELQLEPVESGSPVVTVLINGSARRLLVEPGALWTAVSTSAAAKLGLEPLPLLPLGAADAEAGAAVSQFAAADRIEIGALAWPHPKVLLLPEKVIGPELDGVLGSDLLAPYDLEFDFAKHMLRLVPQKPCRGPVVNWTRDYVAVPFDISANRHLVVPMKLDGKRVSVSIDTARVKTAMSESSAGRLFGLSSSSAGVDVPADATTAKTLRFRKQFESLSISGVTIRHPTIYVWADGPSRAPPSSPTAGNGAEPATGIVLEQQDLAVGTDVLRHLHLYIGSAEKMLYVSTADAHN